MTRTPSISEDNAGFRLCVCCGRLAVFASLWTSRSRFPRGRATVRLAAWFTRLLLLGIILCCCLRATGQMEYQVKGSLTLTRFDTVRYIGQPTVTSNRFDLFAKGGRWKICIYTYESAGPRLAWLVGSPDGTNVISESGPDGSLVEVATQPFPNYHGATHLWFAFLSSSFLAGVTNSQLPPVYRYGAIMYGQEKDDPCGFTNQTVQLVLADSTPRLPRYAAFYNAGVNNCSPLPPPFDKGYINALYTARDPQRVGSMELPREVTFAQNEPIFDRLNSSSNNVSPAVLFEARADLVLDHCDEELVAIHLPKDFMCQDHRVRGGREPYVRYWRKDFQDLPTVEVLQKFEEASRRNPVEQTRRLEIEAFEATLKARTNGPTPAEVVATMTSIHQKFHKPPSRVGIVAILLTVLAPLVVCLVFRLCSRKHRQRQ
jgi:hypothetical protein